MVQPRRLVELRVRDAARAASPPAPADAAAGAPAKIEAKVDWGRYRLEVSTADGSGLDLQHGVQRRLLCRRGADSSEMLDVALDKPSYQAGETARVKIASRAWPAAR